MSGLRRLRPFDAWGPDFTRPRWIDGREFEQADKCKRRTPGGRQNSHATRTLAERSAPPGVCPPRETMVAHDGAVHGQFGGIHCRFSCLKPQKAPYVPANRPSFPDDKNPRNCGRSARRATVCEPNSERSPAVCAQYHPPVSACKIPFPGLHDGSGWTETAGAPTWRQQAVEEPEARGAT